MSIELYITGHYECLSLSHSKPRGFYVIGIFVFFISFKMLNLKNLLSNGATTLSIKTLDIKTFSITLTNVTLSITIKNMTLNTTIKM